jgi:CRP-like cAMP-binding protein
MVDSSKSPNHFISSLSARDLADLEPHLKPVELRAGDLLQRAESAILNVYFPLSGIVSAVIGFTNGQIVEAGVTGRNSVVGAGAPLDGTIALNDATVQVSGSGLAAEIASVIQLAAQSETLRTRFARHEEMTLAQVQRVAACNAIHSLEERLSRWLMQSYDLLDCNTLPFTQELLSQMLGVQRSSVSEVAGRLQAAGLIAYHRGEIEVLDVEALRASCCECYQAINAKYLKLIGWAPASAT